MREFKIGNKLVGENHPAFIIAEIGINHQGDVNIAKQLIKKAHECGADAVKFQKRKISRILTKEGLEMPYDNHNSFGKTYGEHKRALELSESDYAELKSFTDELGILFCASGWDEESIDFLNNLGVKFFKMASADLTNIPLLQYTAQKGKPIILSTGMAEMIDVDRAVSVLQKYNAAFAILQCTSTYPSQFCEINLRVLKTFAQRFPNVVLGYSGHELGIAIPIGAVAMGARIVERHFTLDRTMKGGDHAASLEPGGFSKMVRDIRHLEEAFGSDKKQVQESEIPVFRKLAKSIVSACVIRQGTTITRNMLTTKGPGTGISPAKMDEIVGKITTQEIAEDIVLDEKMFN